MIIMEKKMGLTHNEQRIQRSTNESKATTMTLRISVRVCVCIVRWWLELKQLKNSFFSFLDRKVTDICIQFISADRQKEEEDDNPLGCGRRIHRRRRRRCCHLRLDPVEEFSHTSRHSRLIRSSATDTPGNYSGQYPTSSLEYHHRSTAITLQTHISKLEFNLKKNRVNYLLIN